MHEKPCGLLNVCDYYRKLLEFLDHCVSQKFVQSKHQAMIVVEESSEALLDRFAEYRAPAVSKWIDV